MSPQKPPKAVPAGEEWPYNARDLAFFATLLAIPTAGFCFLYAPWGRPGALSFALTFAAILAVAFYSVTFLIGGLGLIPTAFRRGRRWVARRRGQGVGPGEWLRDDWVDGP